MDLTLKIIGILLTAISVTAAVYNLFTARTYQKQAADSKKLDDAVAQGQRNAQEIAHLSRRLDECDERTEKRLDQIGKDVADMKKLFTDFVIENLRAMTRH
jgi:hypothetical protein